MVLPILLWQGYLGSSGQARDCGPWVGKELFTSPSAWNWLPKEGKEAGPTRPSPRTASPLVLVHNTMVEARTNVLQGIACLALGADWIRRDQVKTLLFRYANAAPPPATPMGKVASRSTLSEPIQEAHQATGVGATATLNVECRRERVGEQCG